MTKTIEIVLVYMTFIVLNLYLFRLEQKVSKDYYTNPISLFFVFLGFIGTGLLLFVLLVESKFFDYKPKKNKR